MGQKTFSATTECGSVRKMTAKVTDVSKALLSVPKIVKAGNTVVFKEGDCFIEDNNTKHRIPVQERNGSYALKLWIPTLDQYIRIIPDRYIRFHTFTFPEPVSIIII